MSAHGLGMMRSGLHLVDEYTTSSPLGEADRVTAIAMDADAGRESPRRHRWRGYCRVKLHALNFEHALSEGHRPPSEANVSRLLGIFSVDKCRRMDEGNFVRAVVNETQFETLMQQQSDRVVPSVPSRWQDVPLLEIEKIPCLNGLHRILAAKRFLKGPARWWPVSLYTDGKRIGPFGCPD